MDRPVEKISNDKMFLEIPVYEENRIIPEGEIVPEVLQKAIDKRIDYVLQKAPQVIDERFRNPEEEAACSLVFRYPEDSHLIPFVERRLFEKLVSMQKELKGTDRGIRNITLMEFDPQFSSLEMEVDDGQIIRGEGAFEHETAHAREAVAAGQKIVYIVTPFVWKQSEDEIHLKAIHSSAKILRVLDVESTLNVSIAPKYPSFEDLMQARRILKDLDDPFNPLWKKLHECETGLPKLNGRGLNHQRMVFFFEEKWLARRNQTVK